MHIRNLILPNACDQHNHNHHQLIIAVKGQALFEIDGKGGVVNSQTGCLAPASETHYFEAIGDNNHIIIDIPNVQLNSRLENLFEQPRYFSIDENLKLLISYLDKEANNFNFFPEALDGCTLGLMASLHHRILGDLPSNKSRSKLNINSISHFIDENLDQKISVTQLAEMHHVSTGHFSELFAKETSVTPYQFILKRRLETAYDLIITTNKPLSIIAEETGFSNQSAMTHAFQRHYGHSPRYLRKT